ncbi:P-loop NTPase family protein [Tepidimicrobium xylanilyticum]|uniref:Baseplate protein J-like barrel domain-containing protein n=2 Tax=Tepidimicrobium xylanilyticum TaxID=1123352 RepID=A0A1H2SWN5_9FIRM|nr:hypothetical protein [Tepidimicrobium xylanilyticum]SDW35937.1 hypothetical protein SAMN05660923_00566 [Tepidimicrobium xylanilyticum]
MKMEWKFQGEAQKIAFARALYRDAPRIILDEPTEALDPISEFEVYSKFNEIVGNKIVLYISHRLSSYRFCDIIAEVTEGGEKYNDFTAGQVKTIVVPVAYVANVENIDTSSGGSDIEVTKVTVNEFA